MDKLAVGDVVKYVIHESLLNKFIAEVAVSQPGFDLSKSKLADFLAHRIEDGSATLKDWVTKLAFDSTLADARDAMLAVKGCQDVFVTQTGRVDEPVLGWLTNTDIARDM